MATASRTFAFPANAEGLVEVGDNANLAIAWIAGDGNPAGSMEWTQTGGVTSSERTRLGVAETWESVFGIPPNSLVTDIQCTGFDILSWANGGGTTNGHRTRIRFVDASGNTVHSAGELQDVSETAVTGGTPVPHGAGSVIAVDSGSQASNSIARLELQLNLTISGAPTIDYEHDNIAITITYGPAVVAPPLIVYPEVHVETQYG